MRRALIVVIVAVAVLLVLDRVGLLVAESQIASRVQKSQGLSSHPGVSIKGFPFLTQVIGGRYKEVDVTARNVTQNGLTVDRVSVYAHGVSVPLGKVLSGSVSEVPVDRADAKVLLGLDHLNEYLRSKLGSALKVSRNGEKLTLTGTLPVPPRVSLSVNARIDVSGDSITLKPASLDDALKKLPAAALAKSVIGPFFTVRLPISQLPFGIRLQRATVTPEGVAIAASAAGLTLRAPSG